MSFANEPVPVSQYRFGIAGPAFPSTPAEFINILAHYHRAEIARMAGWRDRIDRTTNWSITVVAAMLSVSLSTPTAHHGVLLFAMVLVLLLLMIEARRYRFFDVYRARVRRLERNYFAQVLAPVNEVDNEWARAVGDDLRRPLFQISLGEAMSRRLRRNYCWIFLILLAAWLLKITSHMPQSPSTESGLVPWLRESLGDAALGPLPGWLVVIIVGAFYAWLLYATLRRYAGAGELAHGDVHV
jgi:uncharacterized membrane protein